LESAFKMWTLDFHAIIMQSVLDQTSVKDAFAVQKIPPLESHPAYYSRSTWALEIGVQYCMWIWMTCSTVRLAPKQSKMGVDHHPWGGQQVPNINITAYSIWWRQSVTPLPNKWSILCIFFPNSSFVRELVFKL
jgi:hypothetical protein